MRKLFSSIIFAVLALLLSTAPLQSIALAQDSSPVTIYFFRGDGCPHCAAEEVFLEKLQQEDPSITVKDFEVTKSKENTQLLKDVGEAMGFNVSGVPVTVIGNQNFTGWANEENTGQQFRSAIAQARQSGADTVASIIKGEDLSNDSASKVPETIHLPIFGTIDTKNVSLPLLTVLIGTVDGFNPCSMWVLVFLITLLFGLNNRLKMWTLGLTFIIASSAVYFAFMSAWLNLVLFLGLIVWVRIVIGVLALGAGGFNIREYFTKKDDACKVTSGVRQRKIFDSLKRIISEKAFVGAFFGIILLAFAVNLVELICSAGFPVVYTQVLSMSNLSPWQYYGYILFYIFFFMLDDIIVFTIAMLAVKTTTVSTKYSRLSHLIGGVVMVVIGILMLVRPQWLTFG